MTAKVENVKELLKEACMLGRMPASLPTTSIAELECNLAQLELAKKQAIEREDLEIALTLKKEAAKWSADLSKYKTFDSSLRLARGALGELQVMRAGLAQLIADLRASQPRLCGDLGSLQEALRTATEDIQVASAAAGADLAWFAGLDTWRAASSSAAQAMATHFVATDAAAAGVEQLFSPLAPLALLLGQLSSLADSALQQLDPQAATPSELEQRARCLDLSPLQRCAEQVKAGLVQAANAARDLAAHCSLRVLSETLSELRGSCEAALRLPPGLGLDPSTGVIAGCPTSLGICRFLVSAANPTGQADCAVAIRVAEQEAPAGLAYPPLDPESILLVGAAVRCQPLPGCRLGLPEGRFACTPSLPKGLALDAKTGYLSGMLQQPAERQTYRVQLSNPAGRCEELMEFEVQDHIEPGGLAYPNLLAPSRRVHAIFLYGVVISPITPSLGKGSHLRFEVSPALPEGLALDLATGAISGTPRAVTAKTNYKITCKNRKGQATATIRLATCRPWTSVAASEWSVEHVQLWAEESLRLEAADREHLIAYSMSDLFSMQAQGRLDTALQALSPAVRTLIRNEIRSLKEALAGQAAAPLRKPPPDVAVGSAAGADMLPGELRSRFVPETIIGRGGAGTVVSARGALEGRSYRVAIKLVYDVAESRVRELAREAVILQRLDSQHVVKLKDAGYAPRDYAYWFVMDFVAGASLQQLIDAAYPFDELATVGLAEQVLTGLAAIHAENILHCDVKPANIMRSEDRRGDVRYVLVDFGVARAFQAGASLFTMRELSLGGTLGYMSPEACLRQPLGPSADLYGLGAILFQLLTGSIPYIAAGAGGELLMLTPLLNLEEEPPVLEAGSCHFTASEALIRIVRKALWKKADQRYPDAEAMLKDLATYRKACQLNADLLDGFQDLSAYTARKPQLAILASVRQCATAMGMNIGLVEASLAQVSAAADSLLASQPTQAYLSSAGALAWGDYLPAIVMYTFDLADLPGELVIGLQPNDNFYHRLNELLRRREAVQMEASADYLHYLLSGLEALPCYTPPGRQPLWRGIDYGGRGRLLEHYTKGKVVYWSGLSSASGEVAVAKGFAGAGGVLLRMTMLERGSRSRDIRRLSAISGEGEVLLLPNVRLVVTAEARDVEGWLTIDLMETEGGYRY